MRVQRRRPDEPAGAIRARYLPVVALVAEARPETVSRWDVSRRIHHAVTRPRGRDRIS
jgi:hypothetical protein